MGMNNCYMVTVSDPLGIVKKKKKNKTSAWLPVHLPHLLCSLFTYKDPGQTRISRIICIASIRFEDGVTRAALVENKRTASNIQCHLISLAIGTKCYRRWQIDHRKGIVVFHPHTIAKLRAISTIRFPTIKKYFTGSIWGDLENFVVFKKSCIDVTFLVDGELVDISSLKDKFGCSWNNPTPAS